MSRSGCVVPECLMRCAAYIGHPQNKCSTSSIVSQSFGHILSLSGLPAYLAQQLLTSGDVPVRSWCIITSCLRVMLGICAGCSHTFALEYVPTLARTASRQILRKCLLMAAFMVLKSRAAFSWSNLAASFATKSAASLPSMSLWPGIHCNLIALRSANAPRCAQTSSARLSVWAPGPASNHLTADSESVKIHILDSSFIASGLSKISVRTMFRALISAL